MNEERNYMLFIKKVNGRRFKPYSQELNKTVKRAVDATKYTLEEVQALVSALTESNTDTTVSFQVRQVNQLVFNNGSTVQFVTSESGITV